MQIARFRLINPMLFALLAALMPALCAKAQSPPPPLPSVIISATHLSDEQIKQVEAYVKYWAALLTSASQPDDVQKARLELLRPFTGINASISPDFRYHFSTALIPEVEKALESENLHAAVNALIITSQLGTEKAMQLLLRQSDKSSQPMWQLRLQAAFGAKNLLEASPTLKFPPAKNLDWARRLRDASRIEENSLVLRHQFAAINAADYNGLKPEERKQLRGYLLESLASTVERIERANNNPHPNPLLEVAGGAVGLIRDKFLDNSLQKPEKDALGKDAASILVRLLGIVNKTWATAQTDEQSKRLMSYLIGACEGFLVSIDASLRGEAQSLKTTLRQAWDAGTKDSFDAELKQWQDLVAKQPYGR